MMVGNIVAWFESGRVEYVVLTGKNRIPADGSTYWVWEYPELFKSYGYKFTKLRSRWVLGLRFSVPNMKGEIVTETDSR